MTRPAPAAHPPARLAAFLLAVASVILVVALPAVAGAATRPASKVVRYAGWHARVPAGWPVYRLRRGSHVCVRFDRHAVYLGRPGAQERCPAHAVGRTESILVSPGAASGASADTATARGSASAAGAPTSGAVARVTRPREHVIVTATWHRDPGIVRSALGVRSVIAAGRSYDRRSVAAARAAARSAARADRTRAASPDVTFPSPTTTPSTAGEVDTGLGFDACSAPSVSAMTAWAASPFRAVGVYIGGQNMACAQTNLTAAWAAAQATAGWHLIPIYVGLQAPNNGCGCAAISGASAAAQGAAAATDAVSEAAALGLGQGNPIYYDMENYSRTSTSSAAVLTFLQAWTNGLHLAGYASGVYSSELSGVEDLVAEQGSGYIEPDDLWIANWNGEQSTADDQVPVADWADHQRMHQYRGGHTDDYGGTSIDIDSDYVDAATASPGTGTLTTTIAAAPTVSVAPQADGSIDLAPSWAGESGVNEWRVLAGTSPTALATMLTVPASQHTIVTHNADAYFEVQALNASGQQLGSSGTVATRPHVAMFGESAFVPRRGPGGLPAECFGISGCKVSATIVSGHTRLVQTGLQRVAAGGGILHFPLGPTAHRLVARAGDRGLTVTVTLRTGAGRSARRVMRLVPFSVTGRGPQRVAGTSPVLRIVGETDFVSHGWSGGILTACLQSTPCAATAAVTVAGRPIAIGREQTIGGGEISYLSFRMTAAGHRLLADAPGNQLGAQVTVTIAGGGLTAGATATAQVSLDAF